MADVAHRMRRTVMVVLAAVIAALALVVVQPSAAHAGETDTIHSLVNEARWSQGSPGLVRNSAMDAVAANWAATLAQAGTLSHNPNYSSQIPGGWVSAGENVAQGYYGGAAMQDGWMNSAGHRANILGDFTDIGIAYLEAGGTTWGVQVFAKYPGNVAPAAPAPAAAAAPVEPAPAAEAPAPAEAAPVAAPAPVPAVTPTPEAATPTPVSRDNLKDTRASAELSARSSNDSTKSGSAIDGSAIEGSMISATGALPAAPLWAGILGALVVAAAAFASYRLRSRRIGRLRNTATQAG